MKIKYAIYQGEVGLYALEYFDIFDKDLFKARGVLGYHHINPEDLPVVVNSAGGRRSFYPVEDNFVKIIEVDEDEEPLTREEMYPKNSESFEFGWISPEGATYNTGFEGHCDAAEAICREIGISDYAAERKLEERGWVKISRNPPYTDNNKCEKLIYVENLRLTKKQADTLIDLGYSSNDDFKLMLEESERYW